MRRLVFSVVFWFVQLRFGRDAFRSTVHPAWDAPPILRFPPSQTASAIPLQVERRSAWPSEQSDFLRRPTKEFKRQREARLLITNGIHPPFGGTGTVGRSEELVGAEERLAASIEQVRREVFRLGRTQQALFAFVDSLAKVLLTCVPEPGGEAMEAAVARARGRHARLLKSAGQAMVGDSQVAMQDLVNRGEG